LDPLAMGDFLTVGAAISFGLQVVLLDRFSKDHDAIAIALGQTGMSTVVFFLVWPWTDPFAWPTASIWWAVLLTGVGATALGFYVQALAQKRLPTARVVIIISLESVVAMFFGYYLCGDRLSSMQMLGAFFMLAAVTLAEIVPVFLRSKTE
jgi:drug/metabolite transporter (DMT)-like permease